MSRVTVAIPSYNHEKYIAQTIQSVLDQTYQDFEIVITDDGSSDCTVDIIKTFIDPRIRLFCFEKNQGASIATNHCVKEALGKYIAPLCSDDMFFPDKLEKQVKFLDEHNEIGAVFSYAQIIDEDGDDFADPSRFYTNIFKQPNRTRFEWLNYFFWHGNALCHPSVLIRRECYQELGLYDDRFAQIPDLDFWIRLCMQYDIHIIPENLIKFRILQEEKNASGDRPETRKRGQTETLYILKKYLDINDKLDFLNIFPEAMRFDGGFENDLIPFYLYIIAVENGELLHANLAVNGLFDFLKNIKLRKRIYEKYKFTVSDFISLTGENDLFNLESIRIKDTQLQSKDAELQTVSTQLQSKDAELQTVSTQLQSKDAELQTVSTQLQIIQETVIWRMAKIFYVAIERIAPKGTKRKYLLSIALRFFKKVFFKMVSGRSLRANLHSRDNFLFVVDMPSIIRYMRDGNGHCSLYGWAMASSGIKKIDIIVDNLCVGTAEYGLERPDVSLVYSSKNKRILNVGFEFFFDISNISLGDHEIELVAESGDGRALIRRHVLRVVENNKQCQSAFCTVISKNYLSYARTFVQSAKKYHSNVSFFVLLVDKVDGYFDKSAEDFEIITIDDLNIDKKEEFCFKYNVVELNTAVKPFFFSYLFEKYNLQKIVFFDPDILVTNSLDEITRLLDKHSIVLIPHLLEPINDSCLPGEINILRAGAYNLGFIALSQSETTKSFLTWWQERVYDRCVIEPDEGYFVDQKWIDLVPGLFPDVYIMRHAGYNVAYWNIHARSITKENEKYFVNGQSLYFYHFSGIEIDNINAISKHQTRFRLKEIGNGAWQLFSEYRKLILENGYRETRLLPYAYGFLNNGIKIPDIIRRAYRKLSDGEREKFGQPYSALSAPIIVRWANGSVDGLHPRITRLWYEIYKIRHDARLSFPDIFGSDRYAFISWARESMKNEYGYDQVFYEKKILEQTHFFSPNSMNFRDILRYIKKKIKKISVFNLISSIKYSGVNVNKRNSDVGLNIIGYLQGEFGVAESTRSIVKCAQSALIPYVLCNIHASYHKNNDYTFTDFSSKNTHSINLISVNASETENFYKNVGREFFINKYNIGRWAWELSDFPKSLYTAFSVYDEIWTVSNFCLESLSSISPIPVVTIPNSISINSYPDPRERSALNLPKDVFMFLFVFDFLSIFERKNPLAALDAFRLAFENRRDVFFVVKCINSNHDLKNYLILKNHCAAFDNVRLMDTHFTRKEILELMQMCDAYVSLHRSEGFGMTIAEAMYLGKPVIATAYSGNMDFMSGDNSFLVGYKLSEIKENYGPYRVGSVWAEPSIHDAARHMVYCLNNQEKTKEISLNGLKRISESFSSETVGNKIKERLKIMGLL